MKLFKHIIKVTHASWSDRDALHDIDLKVFADVWPDTYWLYWFGETTTVLLAYVNEKPAGFAAIARQEDGIVIEKIGVKEQFRHQSVSHHLLFAAHLQARNYKPPVPMHLAIPEPWLYPGPDDVSGWVTKVGFKATTPFLPKYFHIDGEDIDGVRCVFEE